MFFKTLFKLSLCGLLIWLVTSYGSNANAVENWQYQGVKAGNPTRIEAASVGVSLPVLRGSYDKDTKKWLIDDKNAFFSGSSANNVGGQTVVYAHNWPGLFKDLDKLQVGDRVTIKTDTGVTFLYKMNQRFETIPTDGSIYNYKGIHRLVLLTCVGENDSRRLIEIFSLEKIE